MPGTRSTAPPGPKTRIKHSVLLKECPPNDPECSLKMHFIISEDATWLQLDVSLTNYITGLVIAHILVIDFFNYS